MRQNLKYESNGAIEKSTEQNKSIVRRWVEEGWNTGNVAVIDQVYAPDFVQHEPSPPVPVNSAADLKQYVGMFCTALPDLHFSIDDLIAEGDKVTWRFTSHGTQKGALMGIPPTGKTLDVTGIAIFRLANSRIAECWVNFDTLGMLQGLGVIPMLAPAGH